MTEKSKTSESKPRPSEKQVDQKIAAAIRSRLQNEKLPCSRAFEIARELSAPLIDVGHHADLLHVKISLCQLGLFGYEPQKRIVEPAAAAAATLGKAIKEELVDGRLPCAAAFALAKERRIPRMDVSAACESMKIKISSCQLGAFS